MTEREALKLALEALEASHFLIHGSETKGGLAFCMDGYYSGCFDIDSNDKQTNEAITAIKEALAQPEITTGNILMDSYKAMQSMKVEGPRHVVCQCDKCKAQPEQKPVAWMTEDECEVYTSKQVDGCFQHDHIPLYTTPPQRTWVGLTEKDICEAAVKSQEGISPRDDTLHFAIAIEAKLKEKNT